MKKKKCGAISCSKRRQELLDILRTLCARTFPFKVCLVDEKDYRTMVQDVKRSVSYWDVHTHLKVKARLRKRNSLMECLNNVSRSIPGFSYYQGMHDICLFLLEVCNDNVCVASEVATWILTAHFQDFMKLDFNHSLVPKLDALEGLTRTADPELADRISRAGIGYHFAVPWILTWFTHSITNFDELCAVFQSLLSTFQIPSAEWIIYICAAALILNRENIIRGGNDAGCVFNEAKLSPIAVRTESIIELAYTLSAKYPINNALKKKLSFPTIFKCIRGIFVSLAIALFIPILISISEEAVSRILPGGILSMLPITPFKS